MAGQALPAAASTRSAPPLALAMAVVTCVLVGCNDADGRAPHSKHSVLVTSSNASIPHRRCTASRMTKSRSSTPNGWSAGAWASGPAIMLLSGCEHLTG